MQRPRGAASSSKVKVLAAAFLGLPLCGASITTTGGSCREGVSSLPERGLEERSVTGEGPPEAPGGCGDLVLRHFECVALASGCGGLARDYKRCVVGGEKNEAECGLKRELVEKCVRKTGEKMREYEAKRG